MRSTTRSGLLLSVVLAAGVLAACTSAPDDARSEVSALEGDPSCVLDDDGVPHDLRCAGLYADWSTLAIDPAARPFTPGYELWSDGAAKSRWVILPPGSVIDAHDMTHWELPVGTKLFKEFRLTIDGAERKIETRLLWRREGGWVMTKYVWNDAQDAAVRTQEQVGPIPGSNKYYAPSDRQCGMCHGVVNDVLGFSALLLAAPGATGLTYETLKAEGLLPPDAPRAEDIQFPGQTALERDVMGRLHASCGLSCHARIRALPMGLPIVDGKTQARVEETAFFRKLRERRTVIPGQPDRSALYRRMAARGSGQMPPVATNIPDDATLALVAEWIRGLPPWGSPSSP